MKCEKEKKRKEKHKMPRGRTTAPLKICLCRQVFVHEETSRSHLAWSTDDRILTDFWVIKIDLSRPCLWCDQGLNY